MLFGGPHKNAGRTNEFEFRHGGSGGEVVNPGGALREPRGPHVCPSRMIPMMRSADMDGGRHSNRLVCTLGCGMWHGVRKMCLCA